MLETALVLVRLAQYAGATLLFGSSLFFLYALPRQGPAAPAALPWSRPLLLAAAGLTLIGSAAGVALQTVSMAGSITEGLKPDALRFVLSGMDLGRAAAIRMAAGALAFAPLLTTRPGRGTWGVTALLGAVAAGSLGWMGHGAATEGPLGRLHLASDVLHSLAAALWLGALAPFLMLLRRPTSAEPAVVRHTLAALQGFAGVGSLAVAVLMLTGLVNSWFLVGLARISGLWTTAYGQLLSAKVIFFLGMLGLAAVNRFRLTPRLADALASEAPPLDALTSLRRSLVVETTAGIGILVLVAWLGMLSPVAAG